MALTIEIVTVERVVRTERDVEVLIAPGSEGQLAILPRHAALMTTIEPGILTFRRAGVEEDFVLAGGFMEVRNDRVTILADAAEAAEEIDVERAEAARQRAQERVKQAMENPTLGMDLARAQSSLQRSLIRLRAVDKMRRRRTDARPRM
ncbi:MAG: F0F1 ATP synthase subunit epsilon [Dehalococcoidia bacterium]